MGVALCLAYASIITSGLLRRNRSEVSVDTYINSSTFKTYFADDAVMKRLTKEMLKVLKYFNIKI